MLGQDVHRKDILVVLENLQSTTPKSCLTRREEGRPQYSKWTEGKNEISLVGYESVCQTTKGIFVESCFSCPLFFLFLMQPEKVLIFEIV